MPASYTPAPSTAIGDLASITNPLDGDALTVASRNVSVNKVADYAARVLNGLRVAASTTFLAHGAAPTGAPVGYVTSQNAAQVIALCNNASSTTNIQLSNDFGNTWGSSAALPAATQMLCGYHDGATWTVAGTGGALWTSTDGINWTARTSNLATDITGITKSSSLWCAVAATNTTSCITTSPDFTTTAGTVRTSAFATVVGSGVSVIWSSQASLFCVFNALGGGGTAFYETSPDGITWTQRTPSGLLTTANFGWTGGGINGRGAACALVPFNGVPTLVAGGYTTNTTTVGILTSTDGINWTVRQNQTATIFTHFGWNGALCVAPALGSSGRSAWTSSDGITWTQRPINTTATFATVYTCASFPAQGFVLLLTQLRSLPVPSV